MIVFFMIRKETFERLHFTLDSAIGCLLGSTFEVKGGKLSRFNAEEDVDELLKPKNNIGEYGHFFITVFFCIMQDGLSMYVH